MRYFLLGVVVLFSAPAWAQYNEAVSAISFNPSLTGVYNYLKIVKEAKLVGIDACKLGSGECKSTSNVNIASKGEVEVTKSTCPEGETCSATIEVENIKTRKSDDASYDPGENPHHTILVTGENSVVCNPTSETECSLPDDMSSLTLDTYNNQGITLELFKGATLQSDGKTFVEELIWNGTSLTLQGTGNEATLVLREAQTLNVTESIRLGNEIIDNPSIPDSAKFKWCNKEGYRVLGIDGCAE